LPTKKIDTVPIKKLVRKIESICKRPSTQTEVDSVLSARDTIVSKLGKTKTEEAVKNELYQLEAAFRPYQRDSNPNKYMIPGLYSSEVWLNTMSLKEEQGVLWDNQNLVSLVCFRLLDTIGELDSWEKKP
jgi:hypothetical protein